MDFLNFANDEQKILIKILKVIHAWIQVGDWHKATLTKTSGKQVREWN